MKKIMKTLSLLFAVGAMAFGSGLHHEKSAEVAKAATEWNLVTNDNDLKAGDKIIITDKTAKYAMGAISTASTKYGTRINLSNSSTTISDSDLPSNIAKFELSGNSSAWTIKGIQTISGSLTWTSGNSLTSTTSNADTWTISIAQDSTSKIKNCQDTTRLLQYNASSPRFACYTGSQQDVKLYKEASANTQTLTSISVNDDYTKTYNEGESFDKSSLEVTAHYDDNTSKVVTDYTLSPSGALDASNTKVTISYKYGDVTKTLDLPITVTARELVSVTLASEPTKTEYYVGQSLDLTGLKLTASYNIGDALEITSGYTTDPASGYTFTSDDIGTYEVTVDFEGKTTLFEVEVLDKPVYTLVSDSSALSIGDKIVIVAKDSNVALSTTQNSNNRSQSDVTKDGNTVSFDDKTQVITLEKGTTEGTFAFNVGNGYLYAAGGTGKNNYLKTQTTLTAAGSWNITISNNEATVKTADTTVARHTLFYNDSNKIFSCYASGQKAISIYKEGSVVEKEITSLSCEGTPTKTTYIEGQSFDPTGLTINATYSNGSTGTMSPNLLSWSPEMLTSSTTSVTGTYGEFSVTIDNIVVNPLTTFGFPISTNSEIMLDIPNAGDVTEKSYFAMGTIIEVQNTTYGNLLIKDKNGDELLIYGTYLDSKANGVRYDKMEAKPVVGDAIIVYGIAKNYNGTKELVDTILVSVNNETTTEIWDLSAEVIKADTCKDYAQSAGYKTRYDALSDDHKAIFNSIVISSQSEYEGDASTVTLENKLTYMEDLARLKTQSEGLSSNLLSNITSSNNILIILIVGLLGLTSILGYYFLNKKKYAR